MGSPKGLKPRAQNGTLTIIYLGVGEREEWSTAGQTRGQQIAVKMPMQICDQFRKYLSHDFGTYVRTTKS